MREENITKKMLVIGAENQILRLLGTRYTIMRNNQIGTIEKGRLLTDRFNCAQVWVRKLLQSNASATKKGGGKLPIPSRNNC